MDARREAGREAGSGEEQRLPARTRALTAGGGRSTKHRAATSAPRLRAGHAARPVHLHRGAHGEAEARRAAPARNGESAYLRRRLQHQAAPCHAAPSGKRLCASVSWCAW